MAVEILKPFDIHFLRIRGEELSEVFKYLNGKVEGHRKTVGTYTFLQIQIRRPQVKISDE